MTTYPNLFALLKDGASFLKKGPVALIFAKDDVELDARIRHHLNASFLHTVVFAMSDFAIADDVADRIVRVSYEMLPPHST